MAKHNNKINQVEAIEIEGFKPEPLAVVVPVEAEAPKVSNIFAEQASAQAKQLALKLDHLAKAKQLLAEASDYEKEGKAKDAEALRVADKGAFHLYEARQAGASGEEVSAKLIDVYGAKPKKDGSPGKTPEGQGEHVRKRVVRAFAASEYVKTGLAEDGTFFDGLSLADVQHVVDLVDNGATSIWTAYDNLADIKAKAAVKVDPAFDPAKVVKYVDKLASEGSADIIRNSPSLIASYAAMVAILEEIGNVPIKK